MNRVYSETLAAPPTLRGHSSSDSLPDEAAYWNDVRGQNYFEPEICQCDEPVIGAPNTPNRYTCRTCARKVQKWTIENKGVMS